MTTYGAAGESALLRCLLTGSRFHGPAYVQLASGRKLALSTVELSSTYGGLLEGYPCARLNDRVISGLGGWARTHYPSMPFHLIDPPRTYPDTQPGHFGPVEVLPAVSCVGVFSASPVSEDSDSVLCESVLVVAWFQADVSLPVGEDALPAFRELAWENLAEDREL
ncbi:hypothetical protein GCM10023194_68020 [Planotetraspora phitsanulokensis]|uniref:Uncharacterized protein n=1 Tax=Planotetraspora phitsanulokensis TaxID=575192 RepID=A0A8J3XFZ6_9ACTN|nr:hypothetical protein [Planotetraspora phitsanulokensis]GII39635.1 hypothetical protein Pph01_46380 [Planotetraspora phitsanulokensis]